ncbi:MAG: DUF1573 domain-containing protein [Bacteroidales bacterium]|jgi:hypothetical protein|nr:DUF1573 domain-containing protein [Bacteroidales bacterium]
MLKKILSILVSMVVFNAAWAAGEIKFEKTTHDFGTIRESSGDVSVEFAFTNVGDGPLLILRAASSCGCTVPDYPHQPLRAGQGGVIKVTYHAKGRPGPFQKTVTIYDNTQKRTQVTIMGNVVSTTTPEDTYANDMGAGLRSKTRSMNFFDVYPNRTNRTRTLQFYNESDEPIQLTFRGKSKNVHLEARPDVIQPKQEGKVLVTFLTAESKDWGLHEETFQVFVKGKETLAKNNVVTITADIWEDFSKLSNKERKQAGTIELDCSELKFSSSAKMNQVKTIRLTNTGKNKLTIRKICNDLPEVFKVQLEDNVIKSGQSTNLIVTYVPEENTVANLAHHLMIISNDPTNSRVIVNLLVGK